MSPEMKEEDRKVTTLFLKTFCLSRQSDKLFALLYLVAKCMKPEIKFDSEKQRKRTCLVGQIVL